MKDPQDAPDAPEKEVEEEEIKTGGAEAMSQDQSEGGVAVQPFEYVSASGGNLSQ